MEKRIIISVKCHANSNYFMTILQILICVDYSVKCIVFNYFLKCGKYDKEENFSFENFFQMFTSTIIKLLERQSVKFTQKTLLGNF